MENFTVYGFLIFKKRNNFNILKIILIMFFLFEEKGNNFFVKIIK
jgi:hypothetical protein